MFKKILLFISAIFIALFTTGCGGKAPKVNSKVVYKSVKVVYVDTDIPLNKSISGAIQDECALDNRLLESVKDAAKANDIKVVSKANEKNANTLKLKILDAVSSGNAFSGHRKFVIAGGELYENDKVIASFKVARRSGGGFFGSYKSSCAILGGCTSSIANDIVKWLKSPTNNAILGDTRLLR